MLEPVRKDDKYYTYSDYLAWDDGLRWELIDGSAFLMSPAPSYKHQSVSTNLVGNLFNLLDGKSCKVFAAPFDVRLNADAADDTVVQPDIVVICDKSKLKGTGCVGAPDMVIEILSPSTSQRDRTVKFDLYRKSGIREYWIVDPEDRVVSVHILNNKDYIIRAYSDTDVVPIHIFEGSEIDLSKVFEQDEIEDTADN